MKKIEVNEKLIEDLTNINWFSNINKNIAYTELYIEDKKIIPYLIQSGQEINPITIKAVFNYDECICSLKNIIWENVILEWKNTLSMYLHDKYMKEYQHWNCIVEQANKYFDNDIVPRMDMTWASSKDFNIIMQDIKWNILGIILEDTYSMYRRKSFFSNVILPIYQDGHFPCGWEGELPSYLTEVYPEKWNKHLSNGILYVY